MHSIFLPLLLVATARWMVLAKECFACSGNCSRAMRRVCNCHTGSCSADVCFMSKVVTDKSVAVLKGCVQNPPRMHLECNLDFSATMTSCFCDGDMCNMDTPTEVYGPRVYPYRNSRNISCWQCPGANKKRCSGRCRGHYCYKEAVTGEAGCGLGTPDLPFLHPKETRQLCASYETATLRRSLFCACDKSLCNRQPLVGSNPRAISSLMEWSQQQRPVYYRCHKCHKRQEGGEGTCSKATSCLGQFCTLQLSVSFETHATRGRRPVYTKYTGCLNVTDVKAVHTGCSQKWIPEQYEWLTCACSGEFCNSDVANAHRNGAVYWRASLGWHWSMLALVCMVHG